MSCTLAVLMASSMTIELVAVSSEVLSFCSSSIALMPNGVAALPSPKTLAVRLSAIIAQRGMVRRDLGKERAEDGPDQLHQGVNDPRVLGDLEQAEEERQHADETEGDLGGRLGEVERGGGDGVELHESGRARRRPRFHDGRHRVRRLRGRRRELRQAALQLLVARLGNLGDRGQRLGKLGPAVEAELASLPGLKQVAGITRGGRLGRMVEARVPAALDPDLDRDAARGGVVALGEYSSTGSGWPFR